MTEFGYPLLLTPMNIAGINDGGVAGIVFSGFDWNGANQSERVDQLAEGIRTERRYEKQEPARTGMCRVHWKRTMPSTRPFRSDDAIRPRKWSLAQ